MSAHFRSIALGIILLAVSFIAVTSCKKRVAEGPKHDVEPWPVVSVLEWGEGPQVPDGCSLILFSDRRLIVRRLPPENSPTERPTYWMRVLSQKEFDKIDEAASLVLRTSLQRHSYDFGPSFESYGLTSSLYFGLPGKGVVVDIEGVHLLALEKDAPVDFARLLDDNQLPIALRRYWRVLLEAMTGDFETWHPTEVLIEFFFCQTPKVSGPDWPRDWPQPNLLKGGKAEIDEWTCVKMDINRLHQVKKLFAGKDPGQFMEMNVAGMKRLVSYRYQYPGEDIWHEFRARLGIVDLDSFVRPMTDFKPAAPCPDLPKNAFDLK